MTDPRSLQCGQPARRHEDAAAQERMGEIATEVTDAGLELEKRTDAKAPGDVGRFRIRYSAGRGHKGAAIRSYDVSGEGRIAIAFSDERIGVYDRDMNCLFELFFEETVPTAFCGRARMCCFWITGPIRQWNTMTGES